LTCLFTFTCNLYTIWYLILCEFATIKVPTGSKVNVKENSKRGRPQTFNRDQVIEVALISYWRDGSSKVSLNEICKRAGVSKPGIYRAFDGEDGLKQAVLLEYRARILSQFHHILQVEQPFNQTVTSLVAFLQMDRDAIGLPAGCLHADMYEAKGEFGSLTVQTIESIRQESLQQLENWVERARGAGEISPAMPSSIVALYIYAQLQSALRLQRDGVDQEHVLACFRLALSVLDEDAPPGPDQTVTRHQGG
jgi:AcrR family transcriptional regulator